MSSNPVCSPMRTDPQERFNLHGQPGTESVRADLAQRLDEFFAHYADPHYDLWKGGRSKVKRLSDEGWKPASKP